MNEEINIFKCLDYIRDNAKKYAQAKANRVYIEEYKRSLRALIMSKHVGEPVNAQEREAYSSREYIDLLQILKDAIAEEENLRWKLVAAQAKIEVWRSLSANQRAEAKVI